MLKQANRYLADERATSLPVVPEPPAANVLKIGSLVKCRPNTPGPNNLSGRFGHVIEVTGDAQGVDLAKVQFCDFQQLVDTQYLEVRNSIG